MSYMPVALNLEGRKVVIIGGGAIALQKVITLQKYDGHLYLYAKEVSEGVRNTGVHWEERAYEPSLLEDAMVVYAATDSCKLNATIAQEARKRGAIVNVVDDPQNCDFVSPAIEKRGDISIAVTSNGKDVHASINMRNRIRECLND